MASSYTREPISATAICTKERCFAKTFFQIDYPGKDINAIALEALHAHMRSKHPSRKRGFVFPEYPITSTRPSSRR
jgi:hypothetical protein